MKLEEEKRTKEISIKIGKDIEGVDNTSPDLLFGFYGRGEYSEIYKINGYIVVKYHSRYKGNWPNITKIYSCIDELLESKDLINIEGVKLGPRIISYLKSLE